MRRIILTTALLATLVGCPAAAHADPGPDATVQLSSEPAVAEIGQQVTHHLTAHGLPVAGGRITFLSNTSLAGMAASGLGASCSVIGSKAVICNTVAETVTVTVTGRLQSPPHGVVLNSGALILAGDADPGNNQTTKTYRLGKDPELTLASRSSAPVAGSATLVALALATLLYLLVSRRVPALVPARLRRSHATDPVGMHPRPAHFRGAHRTHSTPASRPVHVRAEQQPVPGARRWRHAKGGRPAPIAQKLTVYATLTVLMLFSLLIAVGPVFAAGVR